MGHLTQLVRLNRRQTLSMIELAHAKGWDSQTLSTALGTILEPLEHFAASAIQVAARRRRRLRSALHLQRSWRLRALRPARVRPFVSSLERQFGVLAALSFVSLAILEGTLFCMRSLPIRLVHSACATPWIWCMLMEYRQRKRGMPALRGRSTFLDGIAASAMLHSFALLARSLLHGEELRLETNLSLEFFSLRCLNLAVLLAVMPCSDKARFLYAVQMAFVITLAAVIYADIHGDSVLALILRGPVLFLLVNAITFKVTSRAMRHTCEREDAMSELCVALDEMSRGSSTHSSLVDPALVQRAWMEGPLARLSGFLMTGCIALFATCLAVFHVVSGTPPAISFFSMRFTLVLPVGMLSASVYMRFTRAERAAYVAMLSLSMLLHVVNLGHIVSALAKMVQTSDLLDRASGFLGATEHSGSCSGFADIIAQCDKCPSGNAGELGFLLPEVISTAEHAPVAEAIESSMAFLRGLITSTLPLSPRLRLAGVSSACFKQLISTIARASRISRYEVAVGLVIRELCLFALGVAAGYIGAEGALASLWKRKRLLEQLELNRRQQLQVKVITMLRQSIAKEGSASERRQQEARPSLVLQRAESTMVPHGTYASAFVPVRRSLPSNATAALVPLPGGVQARSSSPRTGKAATLASSSAAALLASSKCATASQTASDVSSESTTTVPLVFSRRGPHGISSTPDESYSYTHLSLLRSNPSKTPASSRGHLNDSSDSCVSSKSSEYSHSSEGSSSSLSRTSSLGSSLANPRRPSSSMSDGSSVSELSVFSLAPSAHSLPSIKEGRPLRQHDALTLLNAGHLTLDEAMQLQAQEALIRSSGSEQTIAGLIAAAVQNRCSERASMSERTLITSVHATSPEPSISPNR